MQKTLRPLIAEFVGTFILVFGICGAIVANTYRDGVIGMVGIAFAQGLALAVAISATMKVSGGHLNPAVTVGLWSIGRISGRQTGLYVAAQVLGAIAAALAIKGLLPEMAVRISQIGTPSLAPAVSMTQGIVIEAILTFFLAFAVMGTAVDPAAPKVGGFAIGLALTLGVLVSGPLTGAALNPARAFGPALVANAWISHLVYWVGPILGSVAAMQLYERVLLKRDTE
jgi:aquaporin Z